MSAGEYPGKCLDNKLTNETHIFLFLLNSFPNFPILKSSHLLYSSSTGTSTAFSSPRSTLYEARLIHSLSRVGMTRWTHFYRFTFFFKISFSFLHFLILAFTRFNPQSSLQKFAAGYHPFYITDDPEGGYEFKNAQERRKVMMFGTFGIIWQGPHV